MVTPREAESTLKTIRSLMERATIYRTISAPTAFCAGFVSLFLSLFIWTGVCEGCPIAKNAQYFILLWLAAAAITAAVNTFLLRAGAIRRNEPFVSPGMQLALRGIIPPLFAGAAVTLFHWLRGPAIADLVILWIFFYGLALLSTQEFAPASIRKLGKAFLAMGFVTGLLWYFWRWENEILFGSVAMGLSFGVLHVIYGILTWRARADEADENDL